MLRNGLDTFLPNKSELRFRFEVAQSYVRPAWAVDDNQTVLSSVVRWLESDDPG